MAFSFIDSSYLFTGLLARKEFHIMVMWGDKRMPCVATSLASIMLSTGC